VVSRGGALLPIGPLGGAAGLTVNGALADLAGLMIIVLLIVTGDPGGVDAAFGLVLLPPLPARSLLSRGGGVAGAGRTSQVPGPPPVPAPGFPGLPPSS
jgi:hypothetical protein